MDDTLGERVRPLVATDAQSLELKTQQLQLVWTKVVADATIDCLIFIYFFFFFTIIIYYLRYNVSPVQIILVKVGKHLDASAKGGVCKKKSFDSRYFYKLVYLIIIIVGFVIAKASIKINYNGFVVGLVSSSSTRVIAQTTCLT